MAHKDETFSAFIKLFKRISNEQNSTIISIRSDHGSKFYNNFFKNFCNKHGIYHNFSVPRIPQQNEVVERKNRSLEEMMHTMLYENNLLRYFWAEVVNTACYILNRALIRPILKKIPYELWKGRKPNIGYAIIIKKII